MLARVAAVSVLPERYSAGKHGVTATVQVPANDVAVMQMEAQLIAMLDTMAEAINHKTGVSDMDRRIQRACRLLAIDIRETIELAKGPQG